MDLRIATCLPLPEPDFDEDILLAALKERSVIARMAAWNDQNERWDEHVPTVIRSTWDYIHDLDRFLAWAERASKAARLWNPLDVVRRNAHKCYLGELERQGHAVVPTVFVKRGARTSLASITKERGWRDVVVKPAVSCSSYGTLRVRGAEFAAGDAHLAELVAERDAMVQPYVSSVEGHGERALVWIDGAFTHAVRKTPRFGDDEECVSEALAIERDEQVLAEAVLAPIVAGAASADDLLYARVDVARDDAGKPMLMELELIEPSLFLRQSPIALERFADAIVKRLNS